MSSTDLFATYVPLMLAAVGTTAAIWAGYESRRARRASEGALRPTPEVQAILFPRIAELDDRWSLMVIVRNRATLSFRLDKMELRHPTLTFVGGFAVSEQGDHFDALLPNSDKTERNLIMHLAESGSRNRVHPPILSLFITWSDQATSRINAVITDIQTVMSSSNE